MDSFINWAKKNYDIILLDTPPIAIVTDAMLAQRFSDVTLFILRFGYSNRNVLRFFENITSQDKTSSYGLVINDLENKRVYGYSYRYGYTYGYNYRSNYGYYYDKNGYYSDDEKPLTWKDKIKKLF